MNISLLRPLFITLVLASSTTAVAQTVEAGIERAAFDAGGAETAAHLVVLIAVHRLSLIYALMCGGICRAVALDEETR